MSHGKSEWYTFTKCPCTSLQCEWWRTDVVIWIDILRHTKTWVSLQKREERQIYRICLWNCAACHICKEKCMCTYNEASELLFFFKWHRNLLYVNAQGSELILFRSKLFPWQLLKESTNILTVYSLLHACILFAGVKNIYGILPSLNIWFAYLISYISLYLLPTSRLSHNLSLIVLVYNLYIYI